MVVFIFIYNQFGLELIYECVGKLVFMISVYIALLLFLY
jgi:hypothetical protein